MLLDYHSDAAWLPVFVSSDGVNVSTQSVGVKREFTTEKSRTPGMSVVSSQNDHCANLRSWLGFILVLSVSRIDVFSEECFLLQVIGRPT